VRNYLKKSPKKYEGKEKDKKIPKISVDIIGKHVIWVNNRYQ
jgi:hypothetical protein